MRVGSFFVPSVFIMQKTASKRTPFSVVLDQAGRANSEKIVVFSSFFILEHTFEHYAKLLFLLRCMFGE